MEWSRLHRRFQNRKRNAGRAFRHTGKQNADELARKGSGTKFIVPEPITGNFIGKMVM